jgi:peptidoglycan/LPS O-acetylase OafA/YrhL
MFFVISGFIITLTVMRKKEFDPVGFTINRFFRIYPTYWVFITLAIILGYISYLFTGSSGTYETVNPRSLIVSYLLAPFAYSNISSSMDAHSRNKLLFNTLHLLPTGRLVGCCCKFDCLVCTIPYRRASTDCL